MGDLNQLFWVKKNKQMIQGPVLEIGSKFYSADTFMDYRSLCEGLDYLGVDLTDGENVDMTIDFTLDFESISEKLYNKTFKTIICCSVLEHVDDIYKFSQNVQRLLDTGGVLFLSVPFTWEFHGYPSDYWRFTPKAVEYLFPQLTFPEKYRTISSHIPHDMQMLKENPNDFAFKNFRQIPNITFKDRLKNAIKLLLGKSVDHRIVVESLKNDRILKVSCINMVGIKQ